MTLTDHVVFPIDCQVAAINLHTYEELAWAGEPEGLLTVRFFEGVAPTRLVPRTRGHAYVLPRPIVDRHKGFEAAVMTDQLRAVERALTWQLARQNRPILIDVAAYLLSYNGWEIAKSQFEIGEALGHRRESISETLSTLEKKKLVAHTRGRVSILTREGLSALVNPVQPQQPAAQAALTPTEGFNGNP